MGTNYLTGSGYTTTLLRSKRASEVILILIVEKDGKPETFIPDTIVYRKAEFFKLFVVQTPLLLNSFWSL